MHANRYQKTAQQPDLWTRPPTTPMSTLLSATHRGLLRLEEQGRTHTAIFSPEHVAARRPFGRAGAPIFRIFQDRGVAYLDRLRSHLVSLQPVAPGSLERGRGRWQAVTTFHPAFFEVLRIVTAFTISHSITLSLAVLGFITLPSRLIESTIAASVVIAALNNLYPLIDKRLWIVAFLFGLVHGLGFANVVTDLALPKPALAVSLVSFNLGVEAGQLAIVAAFLPLAYLTRRSWLYPRLVVGAGSLGIAAVASVWLIERSLNVSIFS